MEKDTAHRETKSGGEKNSQKVSFNFSDADIFEVARVVFGDILKVNYIIDPDVKGRVTFRTVTPIPREEVLPIMEMILRINDIGLVEEKGIFRIVPLEDVSRELILSQIGKSPEEVKIELITLKNIDVEESLSDLETAIGLSLKRGRVKIIPIFRLNALLVLASTAEDLDFVRTWVSKFDRILAVTRPRVNVYFVKNGKAKDLAELLRKIFLEGREAKPSSRKKGSAVAGKSPAKKSSPVTPEVSLKPAAKKPLAFEETEIIADEERNALIVIATPDEYEEILATLKQLDVPPRQVDIEVLIAEVTLTDEFRFGIEWSFKNYIRSNVGNLRSVTGFDSGNMGPSDITGFTFTGVDSQGVVRAFLQALASDSKLKVLASPHIIAQDNEEARIQIGDQIPIVTSETNVQGTSDIQRTIQYRDTGIILKVKPRITENGLISLNLSQEVSDFTIQPILGSEFPVITTRNASTSLVVKDNQTIVIGGLIRERVTKTREYIPILGQIPLLGYLFGYTSNNKTKTELVLLLTPKIVRAEEMGGERTGNFLKEFRLLLKEKDVKKSLEKKEIPSDVFDEDLEEVD